MLPSQRIKNIIEELKISYIDLEKKTGISKSALQRYASGTTKKIPINVIEAIAPALGTTPSHILGWDNPSEEDLKALRSGAYRINNDGYTKYDELSPDNKRIIDTLIDSLLNQQVSN